MTTYPDWAMEGAFTALDHGRLSDASSLGEQA